MKIKILVRKKLNLSPGKLAAQAVHAALLLCTLEEINPMMPVVVLIVNEKPFNDAKMREKCALIKDAGYTEVPAGTETCLAYLEEN